MFANILKRLGRLLAQPITILVIPHAGAPLVRARLTLAFVVFCAALWSGFTLWAGYISGRRIDYWITKLDNHALRAKVRYLARQISDSRDILDKARETDDEMRRLLGLRTRQAVIEGSAVGGPTPTERLDMARFASAPEQVPEPQVQRELEALRRDAERRLASFQEITWHIAQQRGLYLATPNIRPAEGNLTSPFGYRFSPFGHEETFGEFHPGVDIANEQVVTPILASADGVVRLAGWSGGYGQMVLIDHGHGFSTLYGHTSKIEVRPGDRVRRGDVIASMGTTGRSTGTHLHYEVWRDGKPVNPALFLGPRRAPGELVARPEDEL